MPFTGGESTANIYPQWSLLQLNLSTIHSGVFRDFEAATAFATFFTNPHDFS